MAWISKKDRLPPKEGWYQVVKFHEGTKQTSFFKSVPPWKSIEYMQWKTTMKLESDYVDRSIYFKYKCFESICGVEQKSEEIIYWYELEPIPEDL